VISVVFNQGIGGNPSLTLGFIGATVSLSPTSTSQKIHVTSTKALGSTAAGGATNLDLYICYQNTVGGTITKVGSGLFTLQVAQNMRLPFTLSAVITNLAAGTYNVGLCGSSTNSANWNNNEWSYVSAFLAN
jgi:hypothetical protein